MTSFLSKAFEIIHSQTGAGTIECKMALEKTGSIKGAIDYINKSTSNPSVYSGQII